MAGWGEKLSQMTQNAVSKSKELAEITRLNLEISSAEDEIKNATAFIGNYIYENKLCADVAEVAEKCVVIERLFTEINNNKDKITTIRNINVCQSCGAEVSRNSKFCDKCGAAMQREAAIVEEPTVKTCSQCNAEIDINAVFCGNCGAKN